MQIPLSKIIASRQNPRRVKPAREAHQRLVASIRAHGLLEPLVVRPENGHYRVIAGNRRLAALRAVHGHTDAEVPCVLRQTDAEEARELSFAENYSREPMHPLDEADEFSALASVDRHGVLTAAARFGVSPGYVRQRMRLAGLCPTIKAAYRAWTIDTATAEAFAAVPQARQEELWAECGGRPQHAQHVRNLIEDRWIDASLALFDVDTLPEGSVSTDLFRQEVLIERGAFMQAQARALESEREKLIEEGWGTVEIGEQADLQGRIYAMREPGPELTDDEQARIEALEARHQELADSAEAGDTPSPEMDTIEAEVELILEGARGRVSEETKSLATVFLALSPEGKVERHIRVPRPKEDPRGRPGRFSPEAPPPPPTCDDLSDRQRAELYAHEAIAVRHAVLEHPLVRKRLLVLALHDKVRSDGLAIRGEANTTTLHAEHGEGLRSGTFQALRSRREAIDPFHSEPWIEDAEAYKRLCGLSEEVLDELIAVLTADLLSGHGQRETPLITLLAAELKVSLREHWTPDAGWLAGYQKIQLADLIGTLKGPVYRAAALQAKKAELVERLAALFSQAATATGGFDDPELAGRVNGWVPKAERD